MKAGRGGADPATAQGSTYLCCIAGYEEEKAIAGVSWRPGRRTQNFRPGLYLFQGLPKGDKMEWIVQKAVELGAAGDYSICGAERSVVKSG